MPRIKLFVALVLVVGTMCWMVFRSGKTAGAAESPSEPAVQMYGENTEDVARHRWQHNAAQHWRRLVVQR